MPIRHRYIFFLKTDALNFNWRCGCRERGKLLSSRCAREEDGTGKCDYDESEIDTPLHCASLRLVIILEYGWCEFGRKI